MTVCEIHPYEKLITPAEREALYGHSRGLLWFSGLSGSGKSTLAHAVESRLHQMGVHCYVLDGDNVRTGLNSDLGLSAEDRKENIRRTAEAAKLMVDAGLLVFAAFITPFNESRRFIRQVMTGYPYYECYIRCSLDVCEQRDPKGLYKRARTGEVKGMTGMSSPFEEPESPDLVIDTGACGLDECVHSLLEFLMDKKMVKRENNVSD